MAIDVCGKISKVREGSPAYTAGVRAGDELISIDSQPVRDILDFYYLSDEQSFDIKVCRDGVTYSYFVDLESGEELGIEFAEELFDGLRKCHNKCIFCFLRQMPKGLRSSLYQRDDDYRLSFAHGNYITLTNLSESDMDRICTQKMSPLYISVHTTDSELREKMLGNKNAGRIMEQLRRLASARITMHTQIVLCPGVNDGEHLDRTIRDLSSLHPWVSDIAIVPVGLTMHRFGLTPLKSVDSAKARQVVDSCKRWQKDFKREYDTRLVFPSDEFYLLSNVDFPSTSAYEGFPQLEDGVGVSRIFLDELRQVQKSILTKKLRPGRYTLVTGTLATPLVQHLAEVLNTVEGVHARVCTIENKFFGKTVTVAGLLTGIDIADALANTGPDECVLIPAVMLNEDRFLDDVTVADLRDRVKAEILVVDASLRAVVKAISKCRTERKID